MKIYLFYFRDPNENRRLEPVLYAYTNQKELYEKFKEVRDMNKFLCTSREVTKDQYKDFIHQYPDQQLTETKFTTKDAEFPGTEISVNIVCTWSEEKTVIIESDESVLRLFTDKVFDPSILNMKIKTDLYKLGFFTIYQFLYQNMYIYKPLEGSEYSGVFHKDCLSGDFQRKIQGVKADQFGMFMYLYGGTMK